MCCAKSVLLPLLPGHGKPTGKMGHVQGQGCHAMGVEKPSKPAEQWLLCLRVLCPPAGPNPQSRRMAQRLLFKNQDVHALYVLLTLMI